MPHIIPPFTANTDRGYKFLAVFDQYYMARSGTMVLYVEGGIAPYDWAVTGTDFTLAEAQTEVQYNFIDADAAAVIDNRDTVTITDANGVSVEIVVCTCNATACVGGDIAFGDIGRFDICPGQCTPVTISGGCPPFHWVSNNSDYYFQVDYTNHRSNILCAVEDAECLGDEEDEIDIVIIDGDTNETGYPCDASTTVAYDRDNSPAAVDQGDSVTIYITGSGGPFTWTVTGYGFSLGAAETVGLSNTLIAAADACGTAEITITDCGDFEAYGHVRSSVGEWSDWAEVDHENYLEDCPDHGCKVSTAGYTSQCEDESDKYQWQIYTRRASAGQCVPPYCALPCTCSSNIQGGACHMNVLDVKGCTVTWDITIGGGCDLYLYRREWECA